MLYSTVGADEAHLWAHRTDPVSITLDVDGLLVDPWPRPVPRWLSPEQSRTNVWREYDAAQQEIDRRYEAAKAAEPAIDYSRYVWEYNRNDAGEWVPRDPASPAWTIEA